MKPRARRIALVTVAAGGLIIAGLVVLSWGMVTDHVEAWRFVATRQTDTFQPGDQARLQALETGTERRPMERLFQILANVSQRVVICDSEEMSSPVTKLRLPENAPPEKALRRLRECGYRIIEQHLPHRAYVVTGYPDIKLPRGLLERSKAISSRGNAAMRPTSSNGGAGE